MPIENHLNRRTFMKGMAVGSALAIAPRRAKAAFDGPIRLGALVSLTGAGGVWGPKMALLQRTVVDEVNSGGGIGGRQVEYYPEDDQTNPDAGVLAVHKLIDVDHVVAVMGVWSSAVAAPTLPICWQNKVMMLAIAASDSLSALPHQGYFIRTNVHVALQGREIGKFAVEQSVKSIFVLLAQTPFNIPMMKGLTDTVQSKKIKVDSLVYDSRKTSFRSEIDQALRGSPDLILLGGYPQDNIVLMKDIYRAGYAGKIVGTGTGVTSQLIEGAGKDVVEGLYLVRPSPAVNSSAYKKLQKIVSMDVPDTSLCQCYDQVNLALLSIALAGESSGTAIRDNIRKVGGPDGEPVDNVLDGLKLLSQGKTINYEGASGPCEFLPDGNVARAFFRTLQVRGGKLVDI
jgi:branched-chain amino acid transport system substrate-binding protein